MPILILAGLPRRAFKRRLFVEPAVAVGHWNVELFPSGKDDLTLSSCWDAVIDRVEEIDRMSDSPGVHIFAFHKSEKEFGEEYAPLVRDHHRIRRLESALVQNLGTGEFNVELTRLAQIEETWLQSLRPKHYTDPTTLPEDYFEVGVPFDAIWHRVRDYDGSDAIAAIQSLVSNF